MKKISNLHRGRLWLACCIALSLVTAMRWEAEPGTASAQPQAFYSWAEWYPMDRAQASGYRTYNWWTKTSGDPQVHGYYGQSIWNYPGAPEAFPELYRGTSTPIDYFFNWKCTYPRGDSRDPGCEIWTALPDWPIYSFREIISESANDEELQHWAFGSRTRWSVFYRRNAIVDGNGDPTCTRDNVQRYTAAYLQQGDVKQPLVMKLPDSGAYVGPPVCAIGYEGWDQRPDKVLADWTGNWFVETRFIAMSTTGNCSPYPCIQAENIYFSDNPSLRDTFTYCDDPSRPNYAAYCDSATRKGRLGTTYDGSEAVTGWAYAFERYWMRQVPSVNRRMNGFGAFHWWTDDWDDYDWDDTFGSQPGDPLGWSTYQYCQLRASGQDVTCCAAPVSGADFTWSPQSPATGQSVSFDASASGSSPITYNWDFGDGNRGSGDPASHTYTRGGSYTVILTATNSCSQQVVRHTLKVCAPVASASFSRSPQNPTTGQSVSFNASASGSSPITYNWNFGDGNLGSGDPASHTYTRGGSYTVILTATNSCGRQVVKETFQVCAPVASASFSRSPQNPTTGQSVSFNASASGSSPITYNWNFGDGNRGSGDPASHTYTRGGSYTVILTATNSCGRQVVEDTLQVCAPVASASFSRSPQNPTTGQSVSFNASAKGSSPITYNWDWGDNTTASGASVTHEYAAAGVYTITLTAENDCGQDKVSQSLAVTADPAPNFEVYLPLVLCNN